jgi:rSAM/selenodomain-associated transferase 2/rSAM/selenodomain-associated transferase 1
VADQRRRLILFARFPVAGKVKTRLIPALGAEGAAALHRRLVLRTFRAARNACAAAGAELEIRFAGGDANAFHHWLGNGFLCRPQRGGDLGERMAGAFADSFQEGSSGTIIIGTDCPKLSSNRLTGAFERLALATVVFGQAYDGGYYLIGLTKLIPGLFEGIPWGTNTVLADSRRALATRNLTPAILEPLRDLDVPEDLPDWQQVCEAEEAGPKRVSVVIPALNEARQLAATLHSVQKARPHEMFVVDGGSADETCAVALNSGATVIHSKPGRARQMNAGAAQATGSVLLFLHADTVLPENWMRAVTDTLGKPGVVAGSFAFRIAESFPGRRLVEWTTNLRSRWFQTPYGDQTQFLRRALFEELGGFADLPIMEDYELNRRLRKLGRVVTAKTAAITSGRRWKRLGVLRTTLTNKVMLAGYHLGVCPRKLARFYGKNL